jgi:hypothetical protein
LARRASSTSQFRVGVVIAVRRAAFLVLATGLLAFAVTREVRAHGDAEDAVLERPALLHLFSIATG